MIQAVLSNPVHPEYGVATIPFPIPHDQYAHCMELLEALEIGDAVKADCKVEEIDSFYTVLKRMEMLTVNVEELNYLAKRLESFDDGEAAQFQAMAHKLELSKLKDFINLTFCCQQTTVITDFSDLAAIGRDHYMNLHGGSARVDELEALDGEETARQLIENGNGTITPYGVAYDNGIKLEQVYDGQFFPCYYYEPNASALALTSKAEPEDTEHITWLFLPMAQEEIDRALLRAGITDPPEIRLRLVESHLPDEVDVLLDMEQESLADLNALAQVADTLSTDDLKKLGAVVAMAKPETAAQIKRLAENLELFDFAPDAHTPEEYGKYMIQQSGYFDYDENLDGFYDYEGYAQQRMSEEDGMFTDRGYIAYKGYASVDGSSAVKQVSGVTEIPFTSGKAIPYSVTAADGEHVGNYWVTFLTQQAGPKLFVNAANNEAHYATIDGQKMPQREVFLNREYGYHHDVFFANIGDQNIEGLYVKLENAQNVKLDDYWTVGDTTTLSAFTTTESRDPDGYYVYNGDLANFAKVRLVPENDELGIISGTLVIGYTGSSTIPVEEVRIDLTGIAGDPKITTSSVVDGVKFVPYSSVIQTNSLHGGMAFSVTEGALPDGLTLKPNGEIYGIPTKPGEYEFTVKAVYNGNEKAVCEQTYVLTIQDNTDENVLAVNDGMQGYKLLDAVDKDLSVSAIPTEGVLFRSEGTFSDFVAFYLDGKRLVEGTDYDADEGSTRITIRAQTFKNAGNGTHTIAAEFRAGGQADGEMKKTAQNVTVIGVGGSGGNSGSGGSYNPSSSITSGTTTLDVVTSEAKRIANGNMNYVKEIRDGAIKNALAQGHGITVGLEQRIISRGEVPTDDLTLIDKRLGNIGSANMFLEILVAVRDGTTGELLGYVTQTSSKMQFTIDVPQYMLDAQKQGKYIYVMRVHDGKVEFLNTSIKDGRATFSTNKFSTYSLVLMDSAVSGVQTGDTGITMYAVAAVAALVGVGVFMLRRRRQCCE